MAGPAKKRYDCCRGNLREFSFCSVHWIPTVLWNQKTMNCCVMFLEPTTHNGDPSPRRFGNS